uniref:Uncharacterized protein n=1 Tax=Anguilla anguilla TaxID=7936 RepID=A0A0E9SPI3_ANGAN
MCQRFQDLPASPVTETETGGGGVLFF